jgi:hypothetical protein
MSNTKWRDVFSALADEKLAIRQVIVKFAGNDDQKAMSLPSLDAPHAFVDSSAFGPFPLISIEWVEIPATAVFPRRNNLPAEKLPQNVAAAKSALLAIGKQFVLEEAAGSLRIIGHVR